ncbi:Formamidopyrimidine-DNA glycosylase [Lacunisphaera limnophila]|uniref:Formamidopyrimidine-DNA glycosylase n=1 Tax=Lacunisphaera limnophila TaxID=1838286 RepID=A0A1D8AZL1_9BACT|nr:DNA-formamidopyrimidine glycosylase family protein [Lacunisphaera limnophila]AOS46317.1 Formamidopyrimidine-DNA glycosylase [Lacunisphaera limnophila]
MPELAEVEFFRKRWSAGHGAKVLAVRLHAGKKIFRDCDPAQLTRHLTGAKLLSSTTAAKQMLFEFSGTGLPRAESRWLGVHLGMTGELRVEPPGYEAAAHDHLILVQRERLLVFKDPRMFGGVRFHHGKTAPVWWTRIAPAILSPAFTVEVVAAFLQRRARAPIKAVLLMQERFPGIGNWMADEVLWRAAIHPQRPAGSLSVAEVRTLHRECRKVCRLALDTIAGEGDYLPPDLNAHIPKSWLFWHRWSDGGRCPRTKQPLVREEVGGRTTCWSPARQKRG